MIALNNSNSCQDALEKQISDNVALDNNLVLAAKGTTPRQLTRKELKKLRQKTKKILTKLQDNENNESHEDESNLNARNRNRLEMICRCGESPALTPPFSEFEHHKVMWCSAL